MASPVPVGLALDSPDWGVLEHAYGPAADTPALLERVRARDEDALSELYSSIFHQTSVYTASVAAFPHLVAAASKTNDTGWRAQLLALAGGIHNGVVLDFPMRSVSDALMTLHDAAVPHALELAEATLPGVADAGLALHLLQSAAAFAGYETLGNQLEGLAGDELCLPCPGCERELFVWPDGPGLRVASEDPVKHPQTRFTPVGPPGALDPDHVEQRQWLAERSRAPALESWRGQLDALFGSGRCPACDAPFSVIEQLEWAT